MDDMDDRFILLCRKNHFDGITPSNPLNYSKEGYKKMVALSIESFEKNEYEDS
jgi:hypothetical protein